MSRKKGTAVYYPRRDAEIVWYFSKAVNALVPLAGKYGISPETIARLQAHSVDIEASYAQTLVDVDRAKANTFRKNEIFTQAKIDLLRVLYMIQMAANFDESDADAVGFRVSHAPVDLNAVKPVFSGLTIGIRKVIIDWVKGKMDGVVVYGSYNASDFVEIGRDTRSPFYDTRKNRTDQPEVRYYKLVYLKNDDEVGLESNVVKIVVEAF